MSRSPAASRRIFAASRRKERNDLPRRGGRHRCRHNRHAMPPSSPLRSWMVRATRESMGGWVYIMTNRPNGTLYVGVSNDMARRAFEHREGLVEGFTKRYGLKRLVYMECYEEIGAAIKREKAMKHW